MRISEARAAVRRAATRRAIKRQLRILRISASRGLAFEQPNRLAKRHALDCGRPQCGLCSNPRRNVNYKGRERLTRQELRALEAFTAEDVT